jgi:tripartite-type tricarboxylate transporter receptor subunit TctC
VIITSSQPNVLVVNAQTAGQDAAGARRLCKSESGKLAYASVGNGSSSHLNMELLKSMAGFDALHVPFNGRRRRSRRRFRARRK